MANGVPDGLLFPSGLVRLPKYLEPCPRPRESPGNTKTGDLPARGRAPGRMRIPWKSALAGGGDLSAPGSRQGYGSTAGRWHVTGPRRRSGSGQCSRHHGAGPISGPVVGHSVSAPSVSGWNLFIGWVASPRTILRANAFSLASCPCRKQCCLRGFFWRTSGPSHPHRQTESAKYCAVFAALSRRLAQAARMASERGVAGRFSRFSDSLVVT